MKVRNHLASAEEEKMEAFGINDSDHTDQFLHRERESDSIGIATTESEESRDDKASLEDLIGIISSDEVSDRFFSDLDLGLGIETEAQPTKFSEWNF
jgi:hypothetical protein